VNRSIQAFAFAIILLGLTATRARAGLIIALGNDYNLAPGGIGTIDITVTSNNPSGDTLAAFGLELLITRGTSASFLTFTGGIGPYGNSNYVFFGQSSNSDISIPFWGAPYQSSPVTGYPSDSITGGDSADSSGPGYVTITSTSLLLATVEFQAQPGAPLTDQFQISLVNDPNFTYFQYDQNPLDLLKYTSTPGTVTITSVIPEPSSLTLLALSGLSGLLWCCWRGRKHGLLKNSPVATSISTR